MRRNIETVVLGVFLLNSAAQAQPVFVNGMVIDGSLDATGQAGANRGRIGFFSDIYYDPIRNEWCPRTGYLIVADEYGPSVFVFKRNGKLFKAFETPANLVPNVSGAAN